MAQITRKSLSGYWKHISSGNTYYVLDVANVNADFARKKDFPITVIYHDNAGLLWAKKYDEFIEKFEIVKLDFQAGK